MDYLANRQAAGLQTDRKELNEKLDTLARHFGIDWLNEGGVNPLQKLWTSKDALATNELLNLGDAVHGFEKTDAEWLKRQVAKIKTGDAGNRAGAIFELLALNIFLSSGNNVRPSQGNNPGFDGTVTLPDDSSLLVSIKNHGTTSFGQGFRRRAKALDDQFTGWLTRHSLSAELRVICRDHLSETDWASLTTDIQQILDGQLDGTAKDVRVSGEWQIVLKEIATEFAPLSTRSVSSVIFVCTREHPNEQNKFIEDLRKGCSNLAKHTGSAPDDACRVLFVRVGAGASIQNCSDWARDYFKLFPDEKVGIIMLYQAAVVNSKDQTSLSHHRSKAPSSRRGRSGMEKSSGDCLIWQSLSASSFRKPPEKSSRRIAARSFSTEPTPISAGISTGATRSRKIYSSFCRTPRPASRFTLK